MAAGQEAGARYRAFLSYNHKDRQQARWLHRRLEGYRIPRRLAGTEGDRGIVPARLSPIFRDREELAAAGDLSETVRAALAVSESLIVVCSPNAAASPWVAKEVSTFRELHPERPIFAAILEGEPAQGFPAGLSTAEIEPLAADLRAEGDGRRLGTLKLVAGIAGVGLDALVQRDAQRRIRRVTAVTLGALLMMLVTTGLAIFAFTARAEAERQRAQAEGLVEFMLTDLREKLKGVTGLEVLSAANQRALDYYRVQDLTGLPPASLERRARILHAMGEDDMKRNMLRRALSRFEEAAATTSRLLEDEPQDLERHHAHAQSIFWIGHVAFRQKQFGGAENAFGRYRAIANTLVALEPENARWRAELAYAEGNLCTVALARRRLDYALAACRTSVLEMRRAATSKNDPELRSALANRYAWLADVHRERGETGQAWQLRKKQETIIAELLRHDPHNLDTAEMWLTNQFSMAELEQGRREVGEARLRLERALVIARRLNRVDPSNLDWLSRKQRIEKSLRR